VRRPHPARADDAKPIPTCSAPRKRLKPIRLRARPADASARATMV